SPVALANGTLATTVVHSTVSGSTRPDAVVSLETGGDGLFDEGTTTADASGQFSLPVTLAQGANTLQVRASDSNGLQQTKTIEVTLDVAAPVITVAAPTPGLATNQNITVMGTVTDDYTGVGSFQAALDGGAYAAVSLASAGAFNFATALPLNHSADGP